MGNHTDMELTLKYPPHPENAPLFAAYPVWKWTTRRRARYYQIEDPYNNMSHHYE